MLNNCLWVSTLFFPNRLASCCSIRWWSPIRSLSSLTTASCYSCSVLCFRTTTTQQPCTTASSPSQPSLHTLAQKKWWGNVTVTLSLISGRTREKNDWGLILLPYRIWCVRSSRAWLLLWNTSLRQIRYIVKCWKLFYILKHWCVYCQWSVFRGNMSVKLLAFPVSTQDQASEAMEVFNELMESEVSIIVPHVTDMVHFCLEVGAEYLNSSSLTFCSWILFSLLYWTITPGCTWVSNNIMFAINVCFRWEVTPHWVTPCGWRHSLVLPSSSSWRAR